MAFTLNTRKVNDVVVVDMSGQLGGGEPVLLLRNTVRRFMEDGTRKFVLNLGQVTYVDSSGLGELITTYTSARNRQGDVKLLNLSKIAKDILQVTKLVTVFDVFDDETKAVESLAFIKAAHSNCFCSLTPFPKVRVFDTSSATFSHSSVTALCGL